MVLSTAVLFVSCFGKSNNGTSSSNSGSSVSSNTNNSSGSNASNSSSSKTFTLDELKKYSVNKMTLFISHGKLDKALPYEWGTANYEYFKALGADVTFKAYEEGHTVSSQNLHDFRK